MQHFINKILHLVTLVLFLSLINNAALAKNNPGGKETATIGFMSDLFSSVDINDAQAGVKIWIYKIVKSNNLLNNYNVKVKIYNSIGQVLSQMKQDHLAMLSLTTPDYIKNSSKIGLKPALAPSINNEAGANYYILVKKGENYQKLKDLKNKTIGLTSERSHYASILWLDILLVKNHLPSKEKYFKKIEYSEKQSKLILNLFFGETDACVVTDHDFQIMKELNPQIGKRLKYILISPKYLWGLVCFTSFFSEKEKKLFVETSLKFQNLPSGKQLFSLLKMDKLIPFKNRYLDSYKSLMKDYKNIVLKKSH